MAKLKKEKKQRGNDSIFSFRGSRFRNGSFSAAMIIIAIALVIVVNLVVSKLPTKYTEIDTASCTLQGECVWQYSHYVSDDNKCMGSEKNQRNCCTKWMRM